jgi:hypothetical protein
MAHDLPYVRIATPEDEEDVVAMVRRLHAESALFGLNEAKIRAHLHRCYNKDGTIVGVIGAPGRIEASTCMCISSYHYTDDWHLEEFWNFVDEPFRKTKNAEALIEFSKECAVKIGIPLVIGVLANKQMAGKVRLYRRLLGYPTGAFFCFNSKWNSEPIQDHSLLRERLTEMSQKCNSKRVTPEEARREIAPLLREAAQAVYGEDNIWGKSKANGPIHSEGV